MKMTTVTTIFLTLFAFNLQAVEIPFAPLQTIGAIDDINDVFPADLDNDGDLDLVVTGPGIEWHENLGASGAWAEHMIVTGLDFSELTAADIDGDGDLDVIGNGFFPDGIQWYENPYGDATTWTAHFVAVSFGGGVETGDLDGDGDLDLLISGEYKEEYHWYENTAGDGSLWTARLIDSGMSNMYSFEAVDLDGDGDLDTVGAGWTDSSHTMWWENLTIHRSALYPTGLEIAPALTQPFSITTADLDGDGDLDALTSANLSSQVSWWVNDGSAAVGAWTELVIDTGPSGAKRAAAGDIDGDGDLDVLIAAAGSNNTFTWQENDGSPGDGGWIEHSMYTGSPFYDVCSADIDSDGDLDMIHAVNEALGTVAWSENDGTPADGGWTEHVLATDLAGATTATARDLDGDGDLDIVAGGYEAPGEIRWWESDGSPGDGGWIEHQVVTDLGRVEDVVAVDIDLDGDLDIVAGAGTDIRWWESDGSPADGGWIEHIVTSWRAIQVVVMDADADGDIDILGAGLGNGLRWYESDGSPADGGWIEHELPASFSRGAHLGDIDGDGDLDALCAVTSANQVLWWPNLGGQFALPTANVVTNNTPNEGNEALALQIQLNHRGRSADDDIELATLELLFEASAGVALSAAQLEGLADTVYFYLDDGDGMWNVQDAVMHSVVPPYSLTTGVMSIVLADDNLDLQTGFGSSKTYFVTLDLNAAAGTASPDTVIVTHLTTSSSTGEMASTDLPLMLEYHTDTASTTIEVNATPVVVMPIGPQFVVEDEAAFIDVIDSFSDPEGDALVITATGLPGSLSISSDGVISGTPATADIAGSPYTVTVTATDPLGLAVDDPFELTVLSEQEMYSSAHLYWTVLEGEVWRSHADGAQAQSLLGAKGGIKTAAVDAINGHLYYVAEGGSNQNFEGNLHRCDLDGNNQQRIVAGVKEVRGVELDLGAGKIYWIESGSGRVRRANLDGSNVETLISGFSYLGALGLDLEAGTMYFSTNGKIYVAGLDGSGMTLVVTMSGANDIEIDTVNNKLYYSTSEGGHGVRWCDLDGANCATLEGTHSGDIEIAGTTVYHQKGDGNLWRIDLDGNNKQQVSSGISLPRSLAIDISNNHIYVPDGKLFRIDLDGSNAVPIAAGAGPGVHDVAVDSQTRRFYFSDFDQNAVVSASHDDNNLRPVSADSASAKEIRGLALGPAGEFLYWANGESAGGIWRIGIDGSGLTELVPGLEYPHDVAFDALNNKIYWTENVYDGPVLIRRANLDGTGVEDVLTGLSYGVRGLAVDPVNSHIFWTDHNNDEIGRAGLDGSSSQVIVTGLDNPHDVAVDPAAGFLYWTEGIRGESSDTTTGAIRRCNLDGSSVVDIHTGLPGLIRDLTLVTPVQRYTLTISSITGDGTVTAPVGVADGISCGFGGQSNCDEKYIDGTAVTLTASPEAGWVFEAWGGDVDCLDGVVDMTADVACTAAFTNTFHLSVTTTGSGTGTIGLDLNPGWIDCGAPCSEDLPIGSSVTVVPQPDANSVFMDFAGDAACLPDGVIDSGEAVQDLSCSIRFETKLIFEDGFESGDTSAWSVMIP